MKEMKMEEKIVYSECGKVHRKETAFEFEGQVFCEECFSTRTKVCDCCGNRIWVDDSRTFDVV